MRRIVGCLAGFVSCCLFVGMVHASDEPSWVKTLRRELPPFTIQEIPPEDAALWNMSPDGNWFVNSEVYFEGEGVGTSLWSLRLYDRTGRFVRDLTRDRFSQVGVCEWSQTSDALFITADARFFTAPANEPIRPWKLDLRTDTFSRPPLPWLPSEDGRPVGLPIWSPTDDSYLAVEMKQTEGSELGMRLTSTIYRVWVRSGTRRSLAKGYDPVWSPDGRWIAYQRWLPDTDAADWWVMRSDGAGQRPLMANADQERMKERHRWSVMRLGEHPCWLPDRPWLLVGGYSETYEGVPESGVWLFDVPRGTAKWVELGPELSLHVVAASRDGRHVYIQMARHLGPRTIEYTRYLVDFPDQEAKPPRGGGR